MCPVCVAGDSFPEPRAAVPGVFRAEAIEGQLLSEADARETIEEAVPDSQHSTFHTAINTIVVISSPEVHIRNLHA